MKCLSFFNFKFIHKLKNKNNINILFYLFLILYIIVKLISTTKFAYVILFYVQYLRRYRCDRYYLMEGIRRLSPKVYTLL